MGNLVFLISNKYSENYSYQHDPVREIYASVGHKLDKWDRYFDVGLWCPNILLSLEAWKNSYLLRQKGNVLTLTFHTMNRFEQ